MTICREVGSRDFADAPRAREGEWAAPRNRVPWRPGAAFAFALFAGVIAAPLTVSAQQVPASVERDYIIPTAAMLAEPRILSLSGAPLAERTVLTPPHSIDDYEDVVYTAFDGTKLNRRMFKGLNVAVLFPLSDLAPQGSITPEIRRQFTDKADLLYDYYRAAMGVEPPGPGLLLIETGYTCPGTGCCAEEGGRGFEMGSISEISSAAAIDSVGCAYHEMARNFDQFDVQGYGSHEVFDAWPEFLDHLGTQWARDPAFSFSYLDPTHPILFGGPYPEQHLQSIVRVAYDPYISDPANTWTKCVLNAACPQLALTGEGLLNALDYRFFQLHGPDKLPRYFDFLRSYKAGHPPATTVQDKEDIHVQALAYTAGLNLGCYVDYWRWFVSPAVRADMATSYGSANVFCQDQDADGYSPLAGDCDDTDSSIHPGAPEVLNGKDNDCNGVVGDILFSRPPGGSESRVSVPVPSRITGLLEADSDHFSLNLSAPERVSFALWSRFDFQGWLFLNNQTGGGWLGFEYVSREGLPATTSWDLGPGAWTFDVGFNTASLPGSHEVNVTEATKWPDYWGATAPPQTEGRSFRLTARVQNSQHFLRTPASARFWVSGVGWVGSVPYQPNVAFEWTPPVGTGVGVYGYRVQLFDGPTPVSEATPPEWFTVTTRLTPEPVKGKQRVPRVVRPH